VIGGVAGVVGVVGAAVAGEKVVELEDVVVGGGRVCIGGRRGARGGDARVDEDGVGLRCGCQRGRRTRQSVIALCGVNGPGDWVRSTISWSEDAMNYLRFIADYLRR
jgi:hypothetical protein